MLLYLTVASIFLATALVIGTVLYLLLTRRSVLQDRLDQLVPQREAYNNTSIVRNRTPRQEFFAKFGKMIPATSEHQTKYTQYLVAAGFHKESLYIFLGSKFLLAVVLPLLFIVFVSLPKGLILDPQMLLIELALLIFGFIAPSVWLQRKVKDRTEDIFHSLPDILDLLTICVEAGVSIDAALVKTTENPQFKGNPLAEEFKIASLETRAGKLRTEALKDMAERTMVDDVKSFVTMLIQTERFGTSLSQALRVHSDSLRTKRRQLAEELAAKTSVKMLFPLVIFIFPALLVVILGPAIIAIEKAFK
jgi:tight adherence protein C